MKPLSAKFYISSLLQLPRVVHFQKQLLALGGKAKASISFLDHIEALPPPDLLALEASARLSCGAFHTAHTLLSRWAGSEQPALAIPPSIPTTLPRAVSRR